MEQVTLFLSHINNLTIDQVLAGDLEEVLVVREDDRVTELGGKDANTVVSF